MDARTSADPGLAARAAFALLRPRAAAECVDLRLHGAGVDRRVACAERTLVDSLHRLCTEALDSLGGSGGAVTVRITAPDRGRILMAVDTSVAGGFRTSLDLPAAPAGDPR